MAPTTTQFAGVIDLADLETPLTMDDHRALLRAGYVVRIAGADGEGENEGGEGGNGEGSSGGGGNAGGEGELPQAVKDILAKERKARRDAEKRATDAEKKVSDHEAAGQSDLEKATTKATDAEGRATAAERRAQRLEVAFNEGLPKDLASRLVGETEDELVEDAKRLLALVKPAGKQEEGSEEESGSGAGQGGEGNGNGGGFDGGARGSGSGGGQKALTKKDIEAMSPAEINRRWDEVQKALSATT